MITHSALRLVELVMDYCLLVGQLSTDQQTIDNSFSGQIYKWFKYFNSDVSRSRSDGRCGKAVEWAPCALVPTNGRTELTPCCNFAAGRCVTAAQCTCPHCVDYAAINKIAHTVKTNAASRSYASDAFGTWFQMLLLTVSYSIRIIDKISTQGREIKP